MTVDDLPAAFASVPENWRKLLDGWTAEREAEVMARVRAVSGTLEIAPADPFRALRLVAPEQVKMVLLGQDPYPRPGHADGLAFSAGHGKPHSLQRVFSVLKADKPGFEPPRHWRLDGWARQGVLLLNPVLTVEVGRAAAHMHCSWQALTSNLVARLCERDPAPTFMLWGRPAQTFFDAAQPAARDVPTLRTRHPSHDFNRQFMAEGSHFIATAGLVDWWQLD